LNGTGIEESCVAKLWSGESARRCAIKYRRRQYGSCAKRVRGEQRGLGDPPPWSKGANAHASIWQALLLAARAGL